MSCFSSNQSISRADWFCHRYAASLDDSLSRLSAAMKEVITSAIVLDAPIASFSELSGTTLIATNDQAHLEPVTEADSDSD